MVISRSKKPCILQGLEIKHFVNILMRKRLLAIKLHLGPECLINLVWKRTLLMFVMIQNVKIRKKTSSMLGSRLKNKQTICLDNLTISNQDLITRQSILLFQILVQELTLRKKELKPFWTSAYKDLSEQLPLLIKTDCVGLDTNYLNILSLHQVDHLESSQKNQAIKAPNKSLQKTCYQSLQSTVVNKWESENTEKEIVKCRKIRIKVTKEHTSVIDEWIHTSRYVYNKALSDIKSGSRDNFMELRNKHVTENHRTNGRNELVSDWEVNTPKEVRATAVNDVCKAYKTGRANVKAGNIRFFNVSFKKKSSNDQCIGIQKQSIKVKDSHFEIYNRRLKPIKMGKRTKNIKIDCDCRLVKQKNRYFLCIPIKTKTKVNDGYTRIVGIDPGVRKFMTTFSDTSSKEYRQRRDLLERLNAKIDLLKSKRMRHLKQSQRNGYYKKSINKYEIKKENLIDQIHWQTITSLTKTNDVIFYGDIKSHDIVKRYNNRHLNREIMDLKFFKFKERLKHKCLELNKVFIAVNECYTSKTCTNCGTLNDVKSSETYKCSSCKITIDRDINGARNILLKGLVSVCVPSRC